MVFISLEDVVETSCSAKCNVAQFKRPKTGTKVLVTPGSPPMKHNFPMPHSGLFRRSSSAPLYFVLYVSSSIMRWRWVLNKTSTDFVILRRKVRRISGCNDTVCCGYLQRLLKTIPSTRRQALPFIGASDHCGAFQIYLNALVQNVLEVDSQCKSMQQIRNLLEDFLDIANQRTKAIDCVLNQNPATVETVHESVGKSDDNSECAICCGDLTDDVLSLPCGHGYHAGCLHVWLKLQNFCPICRFSCSS